MKTHPLSALFLSSVLLSPLSLFAQNDPQWSWDWVAPAVPGSDAASIRMIDETHGWLSTRGGPVYRTTDGGSTWDTYDQGYGAGVFYPVDRRVIYAASLSGAPTYLRSLDGGVTWDSVTVEGAVSFSLMTFADRENGWAVDHSSRTAFRTTDGGGTWRVFETGTTIASVAALTPDTILYTDNEGLRRTTDGGETWEETRRYRRGSLTFISETTGWLVLDSIYRTTDAGATWRSGTTRYPADWIQFADSLHGYAGVDGLGYYTSDGGGTWHVDGGEGPKHLRLTQPGYGRWHFGRTATGAIQRLDIVTRTFDTLRLPIAEEAVDMAIDGGAIALLFTSDSGLTDRLLWYSDDGGETWEKNVIQSGRYDWRAVDLSDDTIWVAGPTDVLVSTDRGASWRVVFDGVLDRIDGLGLKDGTSGALVGEKDILIFERSGDAWFIHDRLDEEWLGIGAATLTDVRFVTPDFGYVTYGVWPVAYTYDGGTTWHLQVENSPGGAGNVSWVTDSLGLAALYSSLYITIDQGRTWGNAIGSWPGLDGPAYLKMFDTVRGLAITSTSGRLFRTTDRGATWEWMTNTPHLMSDVRTAPEEFDCTSADTCWRLGANGVIRLTKGRTLGVESDRESQNVLRIDLTWWENEIDPTKTGGSR